MSEKSALTKGYLKIKFVLVISPKKGDFGDQISVWIDFIFFRANFPYLEYFECRLQKLTYRAFFLLNFHKWTQICYHNFKSLSNMEFKNSSWYYICRMIWSYKISYVHRFLNLIAICVQLWKMSMKNALYLFISANTKVEVLWWMHMHTMSKI